MRELMDHTSRPLLYAQANRARFVSELKEFIRFPSVSARPEHLPNFYKGIDTSIWLLNEVRRNERRVKDGATQMYGPTQFELSRYRNHDYRLPLPCGKR